MALAPNPGMSNYLRGISRNRALASQLMAQAINPDTTPVRSTGEGLARMAKSLVQGYFARRAGQQANKDEQDYTDILSKSLAAGDAKPWIPPVGEKIYGTPSTHVDPGAADPVLTAAQIQERSARAPKPGMQAIIKSLASSGIPAAVQLAMQMDMQRRSSQEGMKQALELLRGKEDIFLQGRGDPQYLKEVAEARLRSLDRLAAEAEVGEDAYLAGRGDPNYIAKVREANTMPLDDFTARANATSNASAAAKKKSAAPVYENFVDPNDRTKVIRANVNDAEDMKRVPDTYISAGDASLTDKTTDFQNVVDKDGKLLGNFNIADKTVRGSLPEGWAKTGNVSLGDGTPRFENVVGPDGKELGSHDINDPEVRAELPDGWRVGGKVPAGEKGANMWLLDDGTEVRSHDGGRTYVAADGTEKTMPPTASKVGEQTAAQIAEQRRVKEVSEAAAKRLRESTDPSSVVVPEIDYTGGAGASGFWSNVVNRTFGAVGFDLAAPESEKARHALKRLAFNTRVTLAEEITGRPSNLVIEGIDDLVAKPGRLLEGDNAVYLKLKNVREGLSHEMHRVDKTIGEHFQFLTETQRTKLLVNRGKLESLSKQYDVVIDAFAKHYEKPDAAKKDIPPAPEGVPAKDWEYMSPEDRKLWPDLKGGSGGDTLEQTGPLTEDSSDVTKADLKALYRIFPEYLRTGDLDRIELNNALMLLIKNRTKWKDDPFSDADIREMATNPHGRLKPRTTP